MNNRNQNHKILVEVVDGELRVISEASNADVLTVFSTYSVELAKRMNLDKKGFFSILERIWNVMEI